MGDFCIGTWIDAGNRLVRASGGLGETKNSGEDEKETGSLRGSSVEAALLLDSRRAARD